MLVDAALGTGVALVMSLVISSGQAGDPHPVAYFWAVGLGALMLARRRYPVIVLAVTVLGLFAYYAAGYAAVGVALPVVAALYSAAEAGRTWAAVIAAAVVLATSLTFRLAVGQDAAYVVGYELASHVALIAAAIALGDSVRSRRRLQQKQSVLDDLDEARHAADAEHRLQDQRLALARELHDSLGHQITVVSLQAEVAREALRDDPDAAEAAVGRIRQASSAMLGELRRTVRVLRRAAEPRPGGSLAAASDVLDAARGTGLEVNLEVDGDLAALRSDVDSAAYRVLQEAVTNTLRHAGAATISVRMAVDAGTLRLHVVDDGGSFEGPVVASGGLAGMEDRARAVGGSLAARRGTDGFEVDLVVPEAVR